jgi:hypothetical protein
MLGNLIAGKAFKFGEAKTWSEVATVTTAEQTVAAPGVLVGDIVIVTKPSHQAGLGYVATARVATVDNLTIKFTNPTASGITPTASEAWSAILFRPELPLLTDATA